ncbi:unnamed protein product [Adineta steineri]|uniref:Uncharacterized protein n=1 Tax=Adineta steineri TaxID=433720 RepID=A0A815IS58_9BILA|nr:unnamed protein product [Adineta steineri]CAF1603754.1 unnamed protein product [Adineta steineri]
MSSDEDSDSGVKISPQSLVASKSSSDTKLHIKPAKKHGILSTTSTTQDIFVYVPDLPMDYSESDLEEKLQTCIAKSGRMEIKNIKCYLNLSIAVVELTNKEDQRYLLSEIPSMIFDKERGINISFVNELNFDSYIVLDQNMTKIPSTDEISHRYMQVYKTPDQYVCEPISAQFSNIFRICLTTLTELVTVADSSSFKIGNTIAKVFPRADCCFFEDLPSNTNNEKLSNAVAVQIGESKLSSTSFYVQHNKETSTAVVLSTKLSKNWKSQGFIVLDGRNLSKKVKLTYRVIVSPFPRDYDVNRILHNKLFAGHYLNHYLSDDHLIIELNSIDSYENCVAIGAIRIDSVTMTIKPHTIDSNPDQCEISAENWYETSMLDTKPDITTIINNPQHPILHYKWNAQNWLEQFNKAQQQRNQNAKYDRILHLLRVTVMLNTIATIRKKKYIVDGQEIRLNLKRLKTIGYDHRSKLFHGKCIMQTDFKTPYESTIVHVVNEDCLILYEKLVSQGYKPLLLNMANAVTPGGGYRKGDGAQEENLFRRSDYYQSLDFDVADKDQSEPLFCTEKGVFKRPTGYRGFYPMELFGAIYTSGITVFRQREIEEGYAYMIKPLSNVCSIAIAAFRDPELNKNKMLENKFAVNTHKKIESIFAIGYHQNHDCLVLSALGCGAFKNPPEHIALLFKSVLTQYAGYFKEIYFAIIDDHNTGNKINPNGNFLPFQRLLDNQIFYPPTILRMNGVSGPYRILNKSSNGQLTLSDVLILHKSPCHHGSKCHDLQNTRHCEEFSHPYVCSYQSAESPCKYMDDEVHRFTFQHNSKCKYGGECTDNDPKHLNEYDHPDMCKDGNYCINTTKDHLFACRHLPICRYGIKCIEYLKSQADHCNAYRHCKTICSYDNCCVQFHDKEHLENTIHSFRPPCPFTPYNCQIFVTYMQRRSGETITRYIENHCLQYSHVCPFGRLCATKENGHFLTSIHIARQLCSDADQCRKLTDEEHLESYSHPGIRDIRLFCRNPGFKCHHRSDNQHLRKYRHGENHDHLSVVPSSNFNSSINFARNQGAIIQNLNAFMDISGMKRVKITQEILNWIRALQPVHRCNALIFESILVLGHVMSRHFMELLKKPKHVAKAVLEHSRIRRIFLEHNIPEVKQNVHELIKLLVQSEFANVAADGILAVDADHDDNVKTVERRLKPPLDDRDINAIHKWAVEIAQASIALTSKPMGIGYDVDKKLGTDKHIFSILGPHHGCYYGDIVISFKQEIMFHPDANFSIQAATSFHSGKIYGQRAWWKDPGTEDKHTEDFHNAKLHCSVPRYEYAAATELVAITGLNKKSMDIDLDTIIQQWSAVDSHFVFEGHLPQLIPLDYIDNVYIPKNLFQTLNPEAQQSARAVFGNSLILTDHAIDLNLIQPGKLVPLDETRKPYLKFILEKNLEKITERMNASQISRGIVITVPGTKFDDQIGIPITISQSYKLYCLDKSQAPNHPEYTYIYWQVMSGDMMLTISNEKIQSSDKDQTNLRYLICYVAEKPSQATEDYHEMFSYLNDGHPLQHYNNMHTARFKAKSNVFYRGCNTDDFFTFCLKITYKTNEVTLSHAGPNGIYNHQKIYYRFDKSNLDLSRLDYIHVSGGSQDVPIRNLIIRHEELPQLHPAFDKEYKIDTSEIIRQRRLSVDHTLPATYYGGEHRGKKDISGSSKSRQIASVEPSLKVEKLSVFQRIRTALLCSSGTVTLPRPNFQDVSLPESATLPTCPNSIYCLQLADKDHANKYFHPCRFNELCQNKDKEPYLVHKHHNVPKCSDDKNCSDLINPVHRAQYRHTGLSDYLYPCRNQESCYDKSTSHRIKYFHGEEIPSFTKNKTSGNARDGNEKRRHLIPCRYGDQCRSTKDPQHIAKYSHPS